MIKGVFHIGIAVHSLEEGLKLYRDTLGMTHTRTEDLPDRGLRVAMLEAGSTHIELLESTREDSVIARYLEKKGPGVHHIALESDDVKAELEDLSAAGIRLVDESPRPGAGGTDVAFLHPKSTGGVLLELCQVRSREG